jgi:hypothetical protein
LFILLLVSLTIASFFSKQVSAIDSTTIINKGIETGMPLLFDFIKERLDEKPSDDDTSPPGVELPTTPGMTDPCADPELRDLCGPAVPNDPCDDPTLSDLCGSEQGTIPYDPYASPYDPELAMQQYWAQFESQLNYLAPDDKQAILLVLQQMIEQELEVYSPVQQQEAIQILQQMMSPELSEMLLPA